MARQGRHRSAREKRAVKVVVTFVTSREQRTIAGLERNGRAALAALAQIMMPEQAGGNGAPWFPARAHVLELFRRRALAKAFYFLNCGGQGQIAHRPDLRAAQRAQYIDVRGPFTDSFEDPHEIAGGFLLLVLRD